MCSKHFVVLTAVTKAIHSSLWRKELAVGFNAPNVLVCGQGVKSKEEGT